jgi:hypothetical protein
MLTLASYMLAILAILGCIWWASVKDQDKT